MRLVPWAACVIIALSACTEAPPSADAASPSPSPRSTPRVASATLRRTATPTPSPSRPTPVPGTPGPVPGLVSVNSVLFGGGGPCVPSGCAQLLRYRVAFPPRYAATTQEMMIPYNSQGGVCCPPPSVVLTVGPQPLARSDDYLKVMKATEDCIFVWTTITPPTIAEAHELVWGFRIANLAYTVGPIRAAHLGRFDVVLQDIEVSGLGTHATAFLVSSGFSFYFHTCGPGNRTDLITVLTAFDTNP